MTPEERQRREKAWDDVLARMERIPEARCGKNPPRKRSKHPPSDEELEAAKARYFASGGKVTRYA